MICYVLATGKQHLGPHVVVGYGIKIFWPGLFITSPDHLECNRPLPPLTPTHSPLPPPGISQLFKSRVENLPRLMSSRVEVEIRIVAVATRTKIFTFGGHAIKT